MFNKALKQSLTVGTSRHLLEIIGRKNNKREWGSTEKMAHSNQVKANTHSRRIEAESAEH